MTEPRGHRLAPHSPGGQAGLGGSCIRWVEAARPSWCPAQSWVAWLSVTVTRGSACYSHGGFGGAPCIPEGERWALHSSVPGREACADGLFCPLAEPATMVVSPASSEAQVSLERRLLYDVRKRMKLYGRYCRAGTGSILRGLHRRGLMKSFFPERGGVWRGSPRVEGTQWPWCPWMGGEMMRPGSPDSRHQPRGCLSLTRGSRGDWCAGWVPCAEWGAVGTGTPARGAVPRGQASAVGLRRVSWPTHLPPGKRSWIRCLSFCCLLESFVQMFVHMCEMQRYSRRGGTGQKRPHHPLWRI